MRNCRRQGRFVFLPVEELLLSRIFRIVVEYRGIWVDCPSVHLRQVCFFPLFRSFFDKTSLRAKVNRTDTRPVTRNFPGKERPDHNGGNRVGIFSTSFPSPSPKRILLIKEETLRHRSTSSRSAKPMLSRGSERLKFLDAWHVISRQGVGGKRRTASFPKRLGL